MELARMIELLEHSGMEIMEDHPYAAEDDLYFSIPGLIFDDPSIFVCEIFDVSEDPSFPDWRLYLWNFSKVRTEGHGVKILPDRCVLQEEIRNLAGDEIAGILSAHVKGIRKLQRSLRKDLVDEL